MLWGRQKHVKHRRTAAIKTNTRQCRHYSNEIYFYPKDENSEYDDIFDFFYDEVNIEQDFIKKEFRQALNNIRFSKVEKIVMEYKINREMSYKEINQITGLRFKTIDNAYARIKHKIKNSEKIQRYFEE